MGLDHRSVASGEREGRQEDEDYEQDHGGEGADEGARDALAEGVELLADGEPVGAHVALVRQVHDRRRRRRAGRQQGQHHRVEEDEDEAAVARPGPDDVHDGQRDGQHEVRAHHRVRRHEEPKDCSPWRHGWHHQVSSQHLN